MIPLVLAAFASGALLPGGDEDSHSISIPRGSAIQAARVGERAEHGGARGFVSLPIVRAARQRSISKRDSDVELFNISTVSYLVERKWKPSRAWVILSRERKNPGIADCETSPPRDAGPESQSRHRYGFRRTLGESQLPERRLGQGASSRVPVGREIQR